MNVYNYVPAWRKCLSPPIHVRTHACTRVSANIGTHTSVRCHHAGYGLTEQCLVLTGVEMENYMYVHVPLVSD